MMNKAPDEDVIVATLLCQVCEADLSPNAAVCFRCGSVSGDPKLNPFAEPSKVPLAPKDIAAGTSSASTLVGVGLTVGLIGILVATFLSSPGLGISLALLTIPPWIRTTLVVFKRSRAGMETGNLQKAMLFVGSAFVTWLVLFVALASCCLTFCFACWAVIIYENPNGGGNFHEYYFWILGAVTLATFLLITLAFTPWIRYRWIRDTTKER